MKQIKFMQYQSAIIALLILFTFFVPLPVFLKIIFLWVIIFVIANQFSGHLSFSAVAATLLVIITYIFLWNGNRMENFEGETEMLITEPMENNIEKKIEVENDDQKIEIVEEKPHKISMMDSDKNEEDDVESKFYGKLNMDDLEDSDEDSDKDDDEETLQKNTGKTKVSGKQAYAAQKQLYDLTTAIKTLESSMKHLTPTLKKGQKVIESMKSLGIDKLI